MPFVIVPEAYRGPTKGVGEIFVDGQTVRQCLESVEEDHRGFLALVLDGGGALHKFVKLFRNEEQLGTDALEIRLDETDRLEVLAAIAGG
jgi:hypothetical protein